MKSPLRQRRFATTVVLAALVGAATLAAGPVAAANTALPAADGTTISDAEPLLDEPQSGSAAIRELGDQLATAAARNDLRPAQLRTLLRKDRTVWVDTEGAVFYVDPAPQRAPSAATAPVQQVAPLEDTFALHSNPGANLTILLDFDGSAVSGTGWNDGYGVLPATHPAWDPDGDGSTFSDSERLMVQEAWAIVAEDYAPFGVDVTTEDPGPHGLLRSSSGDAVYGTRVLISPSDDPFAKICNRTCGGVGYLSVFDSVGSYAQPAWVFPQALGDVPKNVAEAAAHEAGHNLGLAHDGTATEGYYTGHGVWAPIMGVGYYRPVVQWSAGSYTGANNQQDDLSMLASYLGARPDEASGAVSTPSSLPVTAAVISTSGDVDAYLLGTCATGAEVQVTPSEVAPDLDVRAVLYDAAGTQQAVAQPASGSGDGTTASGLDASLTVPTAGDGWVLTVEGASEGSWVGSGYDDYGSLGAYTVSTACDGQLAGGVPGSPTQVAASVDGTESLGLTWAAPTIEGDGPVTGYVVSRSGSAATETLPADARSHTFTGLAAGTTYQLSVRAVNATGAGATVTVNATTSPPVPAVPSAPRDVTGSYDRTSGKLQAFWSEPASSGTAPITGYAIYLDGSYLGQLGSTSRGVDITRPGGFQQGSYVVAIAAVNGVGASPTASVTIEVNPPTVPSAPRDVTGSYNRPSDKLQAFWSEPVSSGTAPITGYAIYLDGSYLGQLGSTSRGADITRPGGFAEGSYVVGVAAVNAGGYSPTAEVTIVVRPPDRPVNDDVANAQVLAEAHGPTSGDNTYATREGTDPTPPGSRGAGGYSVWYSWTPSADGTLTMTTSGTTGRDTTLAAYTGDPGVLVEVAGNDDSSGAASRITFDAEAGTRYLVAVDGFATTLGKGPFTLDWSLRLMTKPATPTHVVARSGDSSATITWDAPGASDPVVTDYTVTASSGADVVTETVGGDVTSIVLSGLTNGATYAVTVVATNALGSSDPSTPVEVVPEVPDTSAPVIAGIAADARLVDPFFHSGLVTVRVRLSDDRGIAGTPGITVAAPGTIGALASPLALTRGDRLDGIWTATFTLPWNASSGPWSAVATASDAGGNSASGTGTPFQVLNDPRLGNRPSAPSGVTALPGNGRARVTWSAPAGTVTDYTVWIGAGPRSVTVGSGQRSVVIEGLDNAKAYTFSVVAGNSIGESPESGASNSVTPTALPAAPVGVTAAAGDGSATVAWQPTYLAADVTSYRVTVSGPGGELHATTVAGDATTAAIAGLTNGTAYSFTVVATNDLGDSLPSVASDSVTPAGAPVAVAKPVAVRGDRSAQVTWTTPSGNGSAITGYVVTASPGGATQRVTDREVTSAVVTGLTNGTAYTFTVVATNEVGDSLPSAASEPVVPTGVPATVGKPSVVRGGRSVKVSWVKPSGNGSAVTGYVVTVMPGGATKTITDPGTTSTVMTGLTNGRAYTLTVVATNEVGDSVASQPSGSVTPAGRPLAMSKPTATIVNGRVVVTWKPASSNGAPITRYRVDISKGSDQTLPGTARKATFSNLRRGSYTFRIVATNAVGSSPTSAPVTVRVR